MIFLNTFVSVFTLLEYLKEDSIIESTNSGTNHVSKLAKRLETDLNYIYDITDNLCYNLNKLPILNQILDPFTLIILLTSSNLIKSDYPLNIMMLEELVNNNQFNSISESDSEIYQNALFDAFFNMTIMHLSKNYKELFND